MRFGPLALEEAEGAIAAHSVRLPDGAIKKGERLTQAKLDRLRAAGHASVVAAKLDAGDVHEDEAAERVARLVAGPDVTVEKPATGRSNLYAAEAGLLVVDRASVDALNRLDPGLTLATLSPFSPVEAGRMVGTVKVIPFALRSDVLDAADRAARAGPRPPLAVAKFRPLKVGLVATTLPGLKPSVLDKTRRTLDERLRPAGAELVAEIRTGHSEEEVAAALDELAGRGADLLVVFGASAITDEADVIPAAIGRAGGDLIHLGMPVDPGNLLLVGRLGEVPVIGAPGCARSPKENGFDWVLNRLLAGLEVTREDITGMGVGGLLMEIVSRPRPREAERARIGPVAAVVLAAGRSRRMGGPNKLLARFDGVPLVRRVVEAALASRAAPAIVVTGHMEADIRAALAGLDVAFVHNPDYAEGLATSLKAGIAAVPEQASGALAVLADMPGVSADLIDMLLDRFNGEEGSRIVLPTSGGKRGNPVLWPRAYFPELLHLTGDSGARHLLGEHRDAVVPVEVGRAAALDVDTPEALAAAGGAFSPVGADADKERALKPVS